MGDSGLLSSTSSADMFVFCAASSVMVGRGGLRAGAGEGAGEGEAEADLVGSYGSYASGESGGSGGVLGPRPSSGSAAGAGSAVVGSGGVFGPTGSGAATSGAGAGSLSPGSLSLSTMTSRGDGVSSRNGDRSKSMMATGRTPTSGSGAAVFRLRRRRSRRLSRLSSSTTLS